MDNSIYHQEFIALVDTIKTYGGTGANGITPTFIAQALQEMEIAGTCSQASTPATVELAVAHKKVRD